MRRALVLLPAIFYAGCAYIGNPKPPALDIPSRVNDLRAAEFGDSVLVQFTIPALTTEGLALNTVQQVEVRTVAGAESRSYPVPANAKGPGAYTYQFAAGDWTGKQVAITVRATGPKGQASEWSNPAPLAVKTPLPAPAGIKAVSVPQGVQLTWQGSAPRYRIFRGAGETAPSPLTEIDKTEFVDAMVDFEAPYKYFVQAFDGPLYMSGASEAVAITPHDSFPPAVPSGVTGVPGTGSIELTWQRNTEDDFAAYQVYRSTEGGEFQRVARPLDAPTYSDRMVDAGKKYSYTVSAVDKTGNESERSATVEVTAQ